jgi:hypothetical protein
MAAWVARECVKKETGLNDIMKLTQAYDFAAREHVHQRRKGEAEEPYMNHLVEVADLVAQASGGADVELVIAALLHDVVEDQPVSIEQVAAHFGEKVAGLVAEITDDKSLEKAERKRLQVEHAAKASVGAKIVKLADKCSNLRALASSPPADWPADRRSEYLAWARRVVAGCRGASTWLEAQFDAAANAAWISFDADSCACMEAGAGVVGDRDIGVDETEGRFADVGLGRCRACGRTWLRYHVEYEAFSESGRWAMCLVDPAGLDTITPSAAPVIIEAAPWHIYGGSFWGHAGQRGTGGRLPWGISG